MPRPCWGWHNMKTRTKLGATALATAGLAGGWALSPSYVKSGAKGIAYALGIRQFKLDGLGRVLAGFQNRADYPPCMAQMHEHVQYVTKVPPKQFYLTDGTRMVEAFEQVKAWYGMDIPLPVTDIYNYEAEALGAKLVYGEIDMPTIDFTDPLIKDPSDINRVDTNLTPDSGRLRYLIDNTNGFKDICGLPKIIPFCAPFSLAVGIRSYPKLIRDMRKDPAYAHELFTWITDEVHPRFLNVISKETGARVGVAADAWSCFPNLTTEMFEEWVIPYNARLKKQALKKGILVFVFGSGDYCEEHVERFDRATMEWSWSQLTRALCGSWVKKGIPMMGMGLTQEWPIEWLQEFREDRVWPLGERPVLAGFNARFIREGPVEAIVDFVKRVIDKLGREGRLGFWFAQIPAATPPEHVHAAVAAIKTYGRYPVPENLDDVKFEMPEFEPFEVWLKKQ